MIAIFVRLLNVIWKRVSGVPVESRGPSESVDVLVQIGAPDNSKNTTDETVWTNNPDEMTETLETQMLQEVTLDQFTAECVVTYRGRFRWRKDHYSNSQMNA
jgi:benzoyl-CoA reductase/2-hydroxyglutaryl-CoA dehydratase subunit BcrC/BadD/HgdB